MEIGWLAFHGDHECQGALWIIVTLPQLDYEVLKELDTEFVGLIYSGRVVSGLLGRWLMPVLARPTMALLQNTTLRFGAPFDDDVNKNHGTPSRGSRVQAGNEQKLDDVRTRLW